jgi:hypothetical protein
VVSKQLARLLGSPVDRYDQRGESEKAHDAGDELSSDVGRLTEFQVSKTKKRTAVKHALPELLPGIDGPPTNIVSDISLGSCEDDGKNPSMVPGLSKCTSLQAQRVSHTH